MRPRDILFYHGMKGVVGVNTSDATATVAQILLSQTAYGPTGAKLTGTMPNNGALTLTPGASAVAIPAGYHNGSGTVAAVSVPVANVLTGTTIAGQAGTMVNHTTSISATAAQGSGNYINLKVPIGFWDGNTMIYGYDANFLGANIPNGMFMFGMVGSGASVKQWASGGTTTTDTAGTFSVAGLAFTPSLIMVEAYNNQWTRKAWWVSSSLQAISNYVQYNSTGQSDYGVWSVNASGFTTRTYSTSAGQTVNWIAIG